MTHTTTSKHRATEPVTEAQPSAPVRSHRAARSTDIPVAALLGLLLLALAAYLAVRR